MGKAGIARGTRGLNGNAVGDCIVLYGLMSGLHRDGSFPATHHIADSPGHCLRPFGNGPLIRILI
jgi:hypothetical protein